MIMESRIGVKCWPGCWATLSAWFGRRLGNLDFPLEIISKSVLFYLTQATIAGNRRKRLTQVTFGDRSALLSALCIALATTINP